MFQLPFHVDYPLSSGVFALAVAAVFAVILWAYDRETSVARVLKLLFEWKFGAQGIEKAHRVGRWWLISMVSVFALMAAFGFIVASGLVRNGDPPQPLTLEELRAGHFRKP
jgi:nitric oxide reductase large subunit